MAINVDAQSNIVKLFLQMRYHSAMTEKKRAPSDRGQGRKAISPTGELMRSRPVRMTDAEWDKCKRLGGAAWLRDKINKAKTPPEK